MQSLYPELWHERQATLRQEAGRERLVNGTTGQAWLLHRAWAYGLGAAMKRWGNNLTEFGTRRGICSTAAQVCSEKNERLAQYVCEMTQMSPSWWD